MGTIIGRVLSTLSKDQWHDTKTQNIYRNTSDQLEELTLILKCTKIPNLMEG